MIFNVVIKGGRKGEIVSMERGNAINVEIEAAFNVKGVVISLRVKSWGEGGHERIERCYSMLKRMGRRGERDFKFREERM